MPVNVTLTLIILELNTVAAGMVFKPEQYRWSSYSANSWGGKSGLVPHPEYMKLGKDIESRCFAYRALFEHQLSDNDIHLIDRASDYCRPVGGGRFCQQIEKKYGISLGQCARGRPKKG